MTTNVLHEYTDEHLTEGASRTDEYGRRCRALLRLSAEKRQSVSAEAWRNTHHTPTEWRQTDYGPMAVAGTTRIVGDFAAEVERLVNLALTA